MSVRHNPSPIQEVEANRWKIMRRFGRERVDGPDTYGWQPVEVIAVTQHAALIQAEVEKREEAVKERESLVGELARLLGPQKPRPGVTHNDQFIVAVTQLLIDKEAAESKLSTEQAGVNNSCPEEPVVNKSGENLNSGDKDLADFDDHGLFVCQECSCIENTALSRFWMRKIGGRANRALCSECDPEIGKWHGRFPKRQYDPAADSPDWIDGEWVGTGKKRGEQ